MNTASIPPRRFEGQLLARMQEWMDEKNNGKLYAPLPPHPMFDALPTRFGRGRFELIEPCLDPAVRHFTALDLGAHWGQFSFFLEQHGYKVTAVESDKQHALILIDLVALFQSNVKVVYGSLLDLPKQHYGVILAMGVFHFFSHSHKSFEELMRFLRKQMSCDAMFLQSYRRDERSGPIPFEMMRDGVMESLGLPVSQLLGSADDREIYMLSRL